MTAAPYPAWPDFIVDPFPLNDNYEQDAPDAVLRSDFEQGEARQRNIFRNAPTVFTLQWAMSPEQYQIFKGFLTAVNGGKFTIPVFSDTGYVTVTAQFVKGSIKTTRDGNDFIVAAQLETMDSLSLGPTDYGYALFIFGSDDSVFDSFHTAVQDGFFEMAS